MSVEPDLTRIVRSWLRTDEHESASRVLNNVLALLDATPQCRPMRLARRTADMNGYVKLAIAAAAVMVVAVVGFNLLPASGGVGGVIATPIAHAHPIADAQPIANPEPSDPVDGWLARRQPRRRALRRRLAVV